MGKDDDGDDDAGGGGGFGHERGHEHVPQWQRRTRRELVSVNAYAYVTTLQSVRLCEHCKPHDVLMYC